jgi:hypothetical protein
VNSLMARAGPALWCCLLSPRIVIGYTAVPKYPTGRGRLNSTNRMLWTVYTARLLWQPCCNEALSYDSTNGQPFIDSPRYCPYYSAAGAATVVHWARGIN